MIQVVSYSPEFPWQPDRAESEACQTVSLPHNTYTQPSTLSSVPHGDLPTKSTTSPTPPGPLVTLTPQALAHIEHLLNQQSGHVGVRLRLRTRGCSGFSYVMEYVEKPSDNDKAVVLPGGHFLFIHAQALMFLIGTEIDYQETPTRSGFSFANPREKGRCGCGTSFHV